MFTDGLFGNDPRVSGGTRFENRPYAQTLKALLIATAKQYPFTSASTDNLREHQGWGFPDLRKLYDSRGKILVVPEDRVILQQQSHTYRIHVPEFEDELKVCMTYLDPAGNPAARNAIVNDLDLLVTSPSGTRYWGNNGLDNGNYSTSGGRANPIDTCENVIIDNPENGVWTIEVSAPLIAQDAVVATRRIIDATYALVSVGGFYHGDTVCVDYSAGNSPDVGTRNIIPFGGQFNSGHDTLFDRDNGGADGGAVYFDVTTTRTMRVDQIGLNSDAPAGVPISATVYLTAPGGTYDTNETTGSAWTEVGTISGRAAGRDNVSYLAFDEPITLLEGTRGMAIVAAPSFGHEYTNGTGSNETYAGAHMTIECGSATNVPFTSPVFSPRVANVELCYLPYTTSPPSLVTTFASNNGGSANGTIYLDLTASERVTLTQIDVNTATSAGAAISIDLYRCTAGPYAGNETTPANWTLVSSGAGTSAGIDTPSVCALDTAVVLDPGTYGLAIVANGFGHRYTNAATPQNFSDPSIQLTAGSASNTPFTVPLFSPRVANIGVHYVTESATYANQRYQMLVKRDLITNSGRITGLAFAPGGTGLHRCDSIQIKMAHLPAGSTLSNTFDANLSGAVTVLAATNSSWPVAGGEWNRIGLQNSFNYDGTSDLVIEVITMGNRYATCTGGFHRDTDTPRIYNVGWSGTPPAMASSGSDGGTKVRLEFGCAGTSLHGRGCADLGIGFTGEPVLGEVYSFDAYNGVPSTPIVLHLGFVNAFPYPIDLSFLGFTDCFLWHDVALAVGTATDTAGEASIQILTDTSPTVIGRVMFGQWAQFNLSAPGGAAFSQYGRAVHGTR